jgi:mannose-6-phosphate isomerase-like protein (cupin superfamily)
MNNPLVDLTNTIAAQIERLDASDPAIRESLLNLLEAARLAKPQPYHVRPHAYESLVARAIESGHGGRGREILEHLSPVQASLPWIYHYEPRSAAEDLGDRIAFAELIGPDGPLSAPDCRVGFTVLAERTTYPLHNHLAVEIYLVLAGNAQWSTASSERRVPPGDLVLHRSGESHAMRTFDEPLLALWGWRGDIDSPAVYV